MKQKGQKGQTLIEVVAAMGIGVILMSAITLVVIYSLQNTQFSKNQNVAKQYAQEGMEVIRQMRNEGRLPGIADANPRRYCLDENSTVLFEKNEAFPNGCYHTDNTGGPTNVAAFFVREVILQEDVANCRFTPAAGQTAGTATQATVKVSWADGKCTDTDNLYCHATTLVSCFSDLNLIPTP